MKQNNYSFNVDVIRVLAMLLVLIMHTMLSFTLRPDFFPSKLWVLFEPVVAIAHTCVLLFFTLSGYLILSRNRSIKDILKRTTTRLLVPLVFFETINSIYAYYRFGQYQPQDIFLADQLKRLISYPSSPLWFLVVLINLYLITPLLGKVFSIDGDRKIARYITLLAFAISLLPTPLSYLTNTTNAALTNFTSWTVFVCFYFYGALVKNKWVNVSNNFVNGGLVLGGTFFTVMGDYIGMSTRVALGNQNIPLYTQAYTAAPIVMIAVGLFNVLIKFDFHRFKSIVLRKIIFPIIEKLAMLSFGIYLIHTYVVSFFSDIIQFDFDHLAMNVYLYNVVNFLLVLSISAAITIVIRKIPKLRVILGEAA